MSELDYLENEIENEDDFENEGWKPLTMEERIENHKAYKLNVLKQLHIKLSNDDKTRILNAKSIPEIDRLGRYFIKNNESTYQGNRKFKYIKE